MGLEGHAIEKPGTNVAYFEENHKIWNCAPSKKRYGMGNVEVIHPRKLQAMNRHQIKYINEGDKP